MLTVCLMPSAHGAVFSSSGLSVWIGGEARVSGRLPLITSGRALQLISKFFFHIKTTTTNACGFNFHAAFPAEGDTEVLLYLFWWRLGS